MKQALSYSQSLRVIGQALEALRINAFELEKKGEEYIVRTDPSEAAGKISWDQSFNELPRSKLRGIRKAAVAPDAVGYGIL
jgi:hypothetical protein